MKNLDKPSAELTICVGSECFSRNAEGRDCNLNLLERVRRRYPFNMSELRWKSSLDIANDEIGTLRIRTVNCFRQCARAPIYGLKIGNISEDVREKLLSAIEGSRPRPTQEYIPANDGIEDASYVRDMDVAQSLLLQIQRGGYIGTIKIVITGDNVNIKRIRNHFKVWKSVFNGIDVEQAKITEISVKYRKTSRDRAFLIELEIVPKKPSDDNDPHVTP